ncbi:cysteine proteinase [Irpex rosettiformis]|uniref:Cysteine proteinase n=1 Tax=Irpex rosettiformis TaxID=378272 RepID=A0ACB8UAF9_9APHY|nr:cysteine proteinase [Irpex rosettiformis]
MQHPGPSCTHLADLDGEEEKEVMLRTYKKIVTWRLQRVNEAVSLGKRRRVSSPTCGTCGVTLSRPFVCLSCSYTGCWMEGHVYGHLRESGHGFCVDARTGSIFCMECDDFVYDQSFKNVYESLLTNAGEKYTTFRLSRMTREAYKPWIPDYKDTGALDKSVSLPCQGRRGLLNLGQTCYLNSILQSFLANPLLRNYFLSDKHNFKACKNKDCTCCEMDKLFSEIYSGDSKPFGPTSFLSTTWRASSSSGPASSELCAGYAQQDAHEFFISALNQIHATAKGSTKASCICIVHTTFDGSLHSEVRCERCGNVNATSDPMMDISLEIEGKHMGGHGGRGDGEEATLLSCLRRYTHPERLGANDYSCPKCGKNSHASKRLSIHRLPPVLSFQFKRFEHPTSDKSSARKIEKRVRFPSTLNMAEFTTLAQRNSSEGKVNGTSRATYAGPASMYEYDLFSVVCHEGSIDNGHYTCFTRHQDEWYRYDDDKVTHSTLGDCLASQAYMCFYVKRHLDYKPYVLPSYIQAREAEMQKEKERELQKMREMQAMEREVDDELLASI